MREHNGMRPQDVVLMLKLALPDSGQLLGKELALALHLSAAEISDSLRRCQYSRLLNGGSQPRRVHLRALLEFLLNGLPYVFPVHPGVQVRGLNGQRPARPATGGIF